MALVYYGLRYCLRLRQVGSLGDHTLELDHRSRGVYSGHHLLKSLTVHEHVARIEIYAYSRHLPSQQLLLVVVRDVEYAVDITVVELLLRLDHVRQLVRHDRIGPHVDGIDKFAARRCLAHVDHTHRHVAQHLGTVSQRIDRRIYQQREDHHQHHTLVGEDRRILVPHHGIQLPAVRSDGISESVHSRLHFTPVTAVVRDLVDGDGDGERCGESLGSAGAVGAEQIERAGGREGEGGAAGVVRGGSEADGGGSEAIH